MKRCGESIVLENPPKTLNFIFSKLVRLATEFDAYCCRKIGEKERGEVVVCIYIMNSQ